MVRPEGGAKFGQFFPAGGKKKVVHHKAHHRPPKEKRERQWGKTPQKPYISSSLGDMARVMMRYACMENTYFYNTEPPPVEFYDFWQKFSADNPNDPEDFIDHQRVSIANLKKNTSSFDFVGKYTAPIHSHHDIEATDHKEKIISDIQRLSDIWKDVRISMSTESFISSSTKISEPASQVQLETGWDEACSEDYQSSESDFGFDIQDRNRHHRHKQHWVADEGPEDKHSSIEFHTAQGLIDKQANAITQSILAMQKRDNKVLYELATRPRDMDIIDHFADDLDDSFLADSYSYRDLADASFGPDFDYLNEDKIYKKSRKGKKGGKSSKGRKHTTDSATGEEPNKKSDDEDDIQIETLVEKKKSVGAGDGDSGGSSMSECPLDEGASDKEDCVRKKRQSKRQSEDAAKVQRKPSVVSSKPPSEGGYDACMERRRRRIEDSLRAAVRRRSPMGSYRPKKGEEPLSKALQLASPGPAAYNPNINSVKPNVHTAYLVPRWSKNIYETPGPGPAHYVDTPKCTCEILTLHEAPRFTESETVGPGPAVVDLSPYHGTAKDKPKALIVSRKYKDYGAFGGRFTNCYGLTRYGRARPPNPLILPRRYPKDKTEPGPGSYIPKDPNDQRVGILIKSRIPPLGDSKSPGFLQLPDLIGDGPAFSFGIRNFMEMKDQSPGPIYKIFGSKPKPVSLTFRPFPVRGVEDEPSPIEWGVKPGKDKIKTLPRAPDPIIHGSHDFLKGKFRTPAPNHYNITECPCVPPGASFKGKPVEKLGQTPGPADYTPKYVWERAPHPVFQHKWKEPKNKDANSRYPKPGYSAPPHRIVGGVMTPRWRDKQEEEEGPELLDIFGMTNRGNKSTRIPISLKSRHTPFKYSHMADPKQPTFGTGNDGKC